MQKEIHIYVGNMKKRVANADQEVVLEIVVAMIYLSHMIAGMIN